MVDSGAPLEGLRIADFSRILAGPFATMVLADLGMEVIKVERPGVGDDTRTWGPPWIDGTSTYYHGLNRNKSSVVLDLEREDDRRLARRLVERSDVLVENFRPGAMARWGLGYDDLHVSHPALVYCSVSGFGSTGPGSDLPAYDLLVQAMSGLMSVTGQPDGPPTKVGVALIDMITGLYAVAGVLAALNDRITTGRGRHVTVSLFESAIASLLNVGSGYLLAGANGERRGNRHPSIAPYQTYRSADGELVLAAGSDKLWVRACHVLGRDDLVGRKEFLDNALRVENAELLERELESVLRSDTTAAWVKRLVAAGVPAGPVNTVAEAFALAERLGCGPIPVTDETGHTRPSLPNPIRLSGGQRAHHMAAPALGEDSERIYRWLEEDSPGQR